MEEPYRGTTPHWHSLCIHRDCRKRDVIGRPPGEAFSTFEAALADAKSVANMEAGTRWYKEEGHEQIAIRCFHTECPVKES
jgi:hypothetical protein